MQPGHFRLPLRLGFFLSVLVLGACGGQQKSDIAAPANFTLAMVSDTQNMVSYKNQKSGGFALDGSEQFLTHMQTIAQWPESDIAFVAAVGDVWQHQSLPMDEDHRHRGFESIENPYFATAIAATPMTKTFELPLAVQGYSYLAEAGIPFGVAPGNHDHDAMWSASEFPPRMDVSRENLQLVPEMLGMLHIGGLDNFRSVFGRDTDFFRNRPWYVASFNGGASSAQTFVAGGYTFLHLALEMQPSDSVLAWAHGVIDSHPGLPTIISTHDYLNTSGERMVNPIVDLGRVDPQAHNGPEALWEKLLSQRDEIFLVLCGHQHGQSRRIDDNVNGYKVYQMLADYQSRGQSALDAGQPLDPRRHKPVGVGDGWFRLLEFELGGERPVLRTRTYSSHYRQFSADIPDYASWYKRYEQPQMTDEEFSGTDEFDWVLEDFRERFGSPQSVGH